MKQTRKVRAGTIDTATLNNECRMVAGDVEQRPMPIQFADDESAYDLKGKDYEDEDDDSIDGRIVALIVLLFAVLSYMIIVS